MRVVSVAARQRGRRRRALLARDLAEHHPDWPVTRARAPGRAAGAAPGRGAVRGARARRPGRTARSRPALPRRAARGARRGRCWSATRSTRGAERVLLLPPDAELRGPLDALVGGSTTALLVPRLLGGLPQDGERPDWRDLLDAGEIDDELVRCARGDAGARSSTGGSSAGARTPRPRPARRGHVARGPAPSPLAAALGSFEGIGRLEDPAYGVSYWNLHERPLRATPRPACASLGFRADRPWWLSEHALAHARARRPGARGGVRPPRAGAARGRLGRRGRGRRRRPRAARRPASRTSGCGACTRRRSRRARTSATSSRRPARARSRAG